MAMRAAAEFEGQGGAWEARTKETLRNREAELKKLVNQSAKAVADEQASNAAATEADKNVAEVRCVRASQPRL